MKGRRRPGQRLLTPVSDCIQTDHTPRRGVNPSSQTVSWSIEDLLVKFSVRLRQRQGALMARARAQTGPR